MITELNRAREFVITSEDLTIAETIENWVYITVFCLQYNNFVASQGDYKKADQYLMSKLRYGKEEEKVKPLLSRKRKRKQIEETEDKLVIRHDNHFLYESDILTLDPDQQVRTKVIDFYLSRLHLPTQINLLDSAKFSSIQGREVKELGTLFNNIDLNGDFIFITGCWDHHWFLYVFNTNTADLYYCSSLLDQPPGLEKVISFLNQKFEKNISPKEVQRANFPQQENRFDCGIYVVLYVEKLVEKIKKFNLSFDDSSLFQKNEVTEKREMVKNHLQKFYLTEKSSQ
jgi:Ulp1 family protease